MKQLVIVGAALGIVAAVTSGCTNGHASAGTVVGQYRFAGGPAPGLNRPEPGTVWAYAGHAALSQTLAKQPVAHVNTDSAGHFTLTLNRGEYTLLGAQGLSHSVKAAGCGGPVLFRVKSSTRTSVKLVCSVP